jgi:tetratricopeptide (TPR) repeat protein
LKLAIEDWQRAMKLNPMKVPDVLAAAGRFMGPEQILSQLLPPDPAIIWTAVEQLHPLWRPDSGRKPFLDRIVMLDGREDWKSASAWAAIARAHAELGNGDAALAAWQKAIAKEPDSFELRNDFSRWLEADERYDAAEAQLQWLRDHRDSRDLLDRLELVRHARKLKAIIEGP